MLEQLIDPLVVPPWVYLVAFVVCALDAFFPAVPSETVVITAGVLVLSGDTSLLWVIAVAAVGAFAGDHVSYGLGHRFGQRVVRRLPRGGRGQAAQAWAEEVLRRRGGVVVVAARFIPGGRTATTLSAGTLRYPLARFSPFDAVAACVWAVYAALLGYWGGTLFEGDPLKGVLAGIAASVCITVAVELTRFLLRRRRAGRAAADLPSPVCTTDQP